MMFYSYLWLRKDLTPYYAGKGRGRRAFISKCHNVVCPRDKSRIVIYPTATEAEAFVMERAHVRFYGRKDNGTGILRNLTDGGDGVSGRLHTLKEKMRIHETLLGNRRAQGHHWLLSDETKQRMKRACQRRGPYRSGFTLSEEHKRKIGEKSKGRPVSEEAKFKIGAANRGRQFTLAARQHMSQAQEGRKHSINTLKKMRESQKLRYDREFLKTVTYG